MGTFRIKKNEEYNVVTLEDIIKKALNEAKVSYGFFSTYDGMELDVLQDMLLKLPGGNELIRKQKFLVLCGGKKDIKNDHILFAQQLLKGIKYMVVDGAFHPKIYLIKYKSEQVDKILLIIASKNITSSSFMDAYVAMSGEYTDNNQETGKGLKLALENICDRYQGNKDELFDFREEVLDYLDKYKFTLLESSLESDHKAPSIEFIVPSVQKDLLKSLLEGNTSEDPLVVMSPFVSKDIWGNYNVLLATTEEAVKKLDDKVPDKLYTFNLSDQCSEDGKLRKGNLHGKVYCRCSRDMDDKAITELYIGSANFTHGGFSDKNVEIMVKLTYQGKELYDEIKKSIEEDSIHWKLYEKDEQNNTNENITTNIEKKMVPGNVYFDLGKISIIKVESIDGRYKIEYDFPDQITPDIRIDKIEPGDASSATRKGKITFIYQEESYSMLFDVVEKLKEAIEKRVLDKQVLVDYEQSIEQEIQEDYDIYQRKLFSPSGITRSVMAKKEIQTPPEDKVNKQQRMSLVEDGMFELVKYLINKYSGDAAQVKEELQVRKNKLMKALPEEQDRFLRYIIEHKSDKGK